MQMRGCAVECVIIGVQQSVFASSPLASRKLVGALVDENIVGTTMRAIIGVCNKL